MKNIVDESMTEQLPRAASVPGRLRGRSINLDISGPGLMLSGRFSDWESGVSMGPDLDQLSVRLAIDATSALTARGWAPPGRDAAPADDQRGDLFSLRSRQATPTAPGVYHVEGELTGAAGTRTIEAQVETSIEHSAVFLLSFQARKSDFGAGWTHLLSNLVSFRPRDDGPSMPAYAWLTVPQLAAA